MEIYFYILFIICVCLLTGFVIMCCVAEKLNRDFDKINHDMEHDTRDLYSQIESLKKRLRFADEIINANNQTFYKLLNENNKLKKENEDLRINNQVLKRQIEE